MKIHNPNNQKANTSLSFQDTSEVTNFIINKLDSLSESNLAQIKLLTSPEILEEIERIHRCQIFLSQIEMVLGDKNNASREALLNRAQRLIKQAKISSISPYDVLYESLIRGLDYIFCKGKSIHNPSGWVYRLVPRVIGDHVRREQRERQLKERLLSNIEEYSSNQIEDDPFNEHSAERYKKVRKSFDQLKDIDKEIVYLHVILGKSYKEIKEHIIEIHQSDYSLDALRQRVSRALKKMRKVLQ